MMTALWLKTVAFCVLWVCHGAGLWYGRITHHSVALAPTHCTNVGLLLYVLCCCNTTTGGHPSWALIFLATCHCVLSGIQCMFAFWQIFLFFLLLDLACFLKGWPVVVEPVTRTIGQISQVSYQQSEYSSASKDLGQLSRDTTLWALCQIGTWVARLPQLNGTMSWPRLLAVA